MTAKRRTKPKKKKNGRPPQYKKEYAKIAFAVISESGYNVSNMTRMFGVSRQTLYKWMQNHKEFGDMVAKGREVYDHFTGPKIQKALEKRAVGFRYTETTQEVDPDTGEMVTVKRVRKHYPPDVAAIRHWQTNRDPENWVEKKEVDLGIPGGVTFIMNLEGKEKK